MQKKLILIWICSGFLLAGCATGRTALEKAYDSGKGDTVKRQYWIMQNRQKDMEKKEDYQVRYYKMPAPTDVNGVKFVPHTMTVRSIE